MITEQNTGDETCLRVTDTRTFPEQYQKVPNIDDVLSMILAWQFS